MTLWVSGSKHMASTQQESSCHLGKWLCGDSLERKETKVESPGEKLLRRANRDENMRT